MISTRTAFPSLFATGSIYFDRETYHNTAKHHKMKRQRMIRVLMQFGSFAVFLRRHPDPGAQPGEGTRMGASPDALPRCAQDPALRLKNGFGQDDSFTTAPIESSNPQLHNSLVGTIRR